MHKKGRNRERKTKEDTKKKRRQKQEAQSRKGRQGEVIRETNRVMTRERLLEKGQ